MSSSNPSACVNCNIQNSNPSFSNSGLSSGILRIAPPPRRYNPGIPNPVSGGGTSDVVNKIVNVASQTGVGSGETKTSANKSNQQTSNILSKILDVASEIVQSDVGKKKLLDNSNRSQQQVEDKKETKKILLTQGRIRRKIDQVESAKKEEKTEKIKKNKTYRSVGTVLASAPEFKAKFNSLIREQPKILMKETKTKDDLPINFDGVKVWKSFLQPIRSQGLCGSCWAFSTLFCLASRLSIYSKGKYSYDFSPAKMVYCGITLPETEGSNLEKIKNMLLNGKRYDYFQKKIVAGESDTYGCSGETLINAWQFLYRTGVPENSCLMYGDEKNPKNIKINLTLKEDIMYNCADFVSASFDLCPSSNTYMVSHRAGGYYFVPGVKNTEDPIKSGTEYNIRKEIYKWGPVSSGMIVYDDFINWEGNGIYEYDKKSELIGGHAIVIMGWGEQNGKKYWIVRNSWGEDWGDKGYFKILRGVNHCEIEENCFVGFPNIPGIRLHLDYPLLYEVEDYASKYLYNIHDSGYKNTTYEQIALGKISYKDISTTNLYDIKYFQDFKTFFAGKITEQYKDLSIFNSINEIINIDEENIIDGKMDKYIYHTEIDENIFDWTFIKYVLIIILFIILIIV
jgi:cathepsin B